MKRCRLRPGSKPAVAQALFDLPQRRADRRFQRQRPGRRLHRTTGADQQRVVEQLAQAVQRIAYCRLAQRQALRRARDVAFAQQGVRTRSRLRSKVWIFTA